MRLEVELYSYIGKRSWLLMLLPSVELGWCKGECVTLTLGLLVWSVTLCLSWN